MGIIASIDVLNAHIVTPPETFPVRMASPARNIRMAELITIVHIRSAMIVEVPSCPLNAVVKALTMHLVLEILRRCIPSARPLCIRARRRRTLLVLRLYNAAAQQNSRRQRNYREYILCLQ